MHYSAVHWANGIFLRPHHFQSADRYLTELIAVQQQFDHPIGYGLSGIQINESALVNGVLELSQLQVRFREGMIVSQRAGDVHRLEIPMDAPELRSGGFLVYLAIPKINEGAANVSVGSEADRATLRYVQRGMSVADESEGGEEQPILFRDYNIRFMFSSDDRNGYETIPIARLTTVSDSQSAASLKVDPEYYPPSLSVQSWPELAAIMRAIHDELTARGESLGKQILEKRITFSSQTQGDLEKLMLLQAINECGAQVRGLAYDQGIHPQDAFHGLCRCIGRLSIFGQKLVPPRIPDYDHDDAAPLFIWARKVIRDYIFSVQDDVYYQRYFKGAGFGMSVTLDPEWFGSGWQWYFGVCPVNSSQQECLHLLRNQLDWVIGSKSEVETYFTKMAPCVVVKRLRQVPSFLPTNAGWVFFKVMTDDDAWSKVHIEKSLAIRVKEEQISDVTKLQGKRQILLNVQGKTHGLEFAIFAAPNRQSS